MAQILCSTGALIGRPNGRDYRLLKGILPKLHCDGIEFMMYSTWYDEVDKLVAFLKAMQLNIPVVHCQKSIGEMVSKGDDDNLSEAFRRFEIDCGIARSLGARKLVLHLWGGIASDSDFQNNIMAYPRFRTISENYGMNLLIENIVCNHQDPMSRWLELIKIYPDINLIFDTKMAAFHNQLDEIYKPENQFLNDRICHYHVNDYAGGYMDWANLRILSIGSGNVDFVRFFEHIKQIGYSDTFTVESTAFDSQGIVNIEMLNSQFEYIRNNI